MNNSRQHSNYDPLDELLAQPAEISNRGFIERVSQQLFKPFIKREHLFMGMGAAWLLLAMVFGSPRALLPSLESSARMITSWFSAVLPMPSEQSTSVISSNLVGQLNEEISSLGLLISQSGMIGIYAMGFLVAAAMFMMVCMEI
jgi:hypothetical protein